MADASVEPLKEIKKVTAPVIPVTIAAALIEIQAGLKPMVRSAKNSSFSSKYVPLEDVITKAFEELAKHKIGVTQSPIDNEDGLACLETTLFTKSGQTYTRVAKLAMTERAATPQGHGSAITYMRRYALMAMLGLTGEGDDDDGNKATGVVVPVTDEQKERIKSLCVSMKYPPKQIEQQLLNVKTHDHAALTIANLEKNISMKVRDDESKANAAEAEAEHGTKIMVGTSEIEPPLGEVDPRSHAGFTRRIKNLNLADSTKEIKVIVAATKAPTLSKVMEKAERVDQLDNFLKMYESGVQKFEADWYAPTTEPIVVDENVA